MHSVYSAVLLNVGLSDYAWDMHVSIYRPEIKNVPRAHVISPMREKSAVMPCRG